MLRRERRPGGRAAPERMLHGKTAITPASGARPCLSSPTGTPALQCTASGQGIRISRNAESGAITSAPSAARSRRHRACSISFGHDHTSFILLTCHLCAAIGAGLFHTGIAPLMGLLSAAFWTDTKSVHSGCSIPPGGLLSPSFSAGAAFHSLSAFVPASAASGAAGFFWILLCRSHGIILLMYRVFPAQSSPHSMPATRHGIFRVADKFAVKPGADNLLQIAIDIGHHFNAIGRHHVMQFVGNRAADQGSNMKIGQACSLLAGHVAGNDNRGSIGKLSFFGFHQEDLSGYVEDRCDTMVPIGKSGFHGATLIHGF